MPVAVAPIIAGTIAATAASALAGAAAASASGRVAGVESRSTQEAGHKQAMTRIHSVLSRRESAFQSAGLPKARAYMHGGGPQIRTATGGGNTISHSAGASSGHAPNFLFGMEGWSKVGNKSKQSRTIGTQYNVKKRSFGTSPITNKSNLVSQGVQAVPYPHLNFKGKNFNQMRLTRFR